MGNEEGKEREEMEGDGEIIETPEEEIKRLEQVIEAKSREAADNYDKYLRSLADLDNYRKRADKEKTDAITYANEALIEDVLPVLDNLERALSHATGDGNVDSLRHGVQLTVDQMYAVLKKYGLQDVKSEGEKFDPSVHHAITEEESEDAAPGTVVKEFQKGYYLKGRLLRPAMVAVAKKPEVH